MQDLETVFKRLHYRRTGQIPTTVTYMEMLQAPALKAPDLPKAVQILQVKNMSVDYLRFLYDQIGSQWLWTARKLKKDAELLEITQHPGTEFHVLHFKGSPAGYLELQQIGNEMEISLFGLFPEYLGKGLGRMLLDWGVHYAWSRKNIQRLWVHTCTLDAKQAIPNYLRAGFKVFAEKAETVDKIEATWE